MVHYASQMKKFGPLINSWTMRQESKLSFFKRAALYINYKNVAKTVARRHQFWICNPQILTPVVEFSPKGTSNTLVCEDSYVQDKVCHMMPCIN